MQVFDHFNNLNKVEEPTSSTQCNDEASPSCAACCISISFEIENDDGTAQESYHFHPKYTHQCFNDTTDDGLPREYIQGYQPPKSVVKSLDGHSRHSSFGYVGNDAPELLVQVALAPSAAFCTLNIEVKKQQQEEQVRGIFNVSKEETISCKRKMSDVEVSTGETPTKKSKTPDVIADRGKENTDHADYDDAKRQRNFYEGGGESPMPTDEIKWRLQKALPPIKHNLLLPEENYLTNMIGTMQQEFTIGPSPGRNKMDFVITMATAEEAFEYHQCVQKLALFYIESASDVDLLCKENGGYWKVAYVFRKHLHKNGNYQYSFVGYMTLYHFQSPFRKPKPGVIVRICQALILTPYQRLGIGRKMLHVVYDCLVPNQMSSSKHDFDDMNSIVEINVEDPAPGFAALRDLVDYERFVQSEKSCLKSFRGWNLALTSDGNVAPNDEFFKPLSDTDVVAIANLFCITTKQAMVVLELDKFHVLDAFVMSQPNISNDSKEKLYKRYRLMVKHRLKYQEVAILQSCSSKKAMKDALAILFDECFRRYSSILKRIRSIEHLQCLSTNNAS